MAEARSFTQGARKLDVSGAQVSKLVARLENRLGARLLNRTTRDVSLTDTGQAYLERARDLIEQFDALESSVKDQSGPSGNLKVSAPVSFGKGQLTPALLDFASQCLSVSLDVSFSDRLVNLVGELVITEAMLAQRHGVIPDLARHTRNLQEAVMGIRMLPISAVFSRFPRLVRELAQRLGKQVDIKLAGETTELDRGMIEKITDPAMGWPSCEITR